MLTPIASRDNPRFKALKKLADSGRERRKTGRILLEGYRLVQAYAERFGPPAQLFVSDRHYRQREMAALPGAAEIETCLLPASLFDELSTLETPDGILAIADLPVSRAAPDAARDAVLLDAIQDPGNLGSIFRSAAAAGFEQILLSADCAQAWSPKTLRAGVGAHFHLNIHEAQDLPAFLREYAGGILLTTPDSAASVYSVDMTGPVAWVFGNEGQGIRGALKETAGRRVKIPMSSSAESLNVAAAAAICLFETYRQRQED